MTLTNKCQHYRDGQLFNIYICSCSYSLLLLLLLSFTVKYVQLAIILDILYLKLFISFRCFRTCCYFHDRKIHTERSGYNNNQNDKSFRSIEHTHTVDPIHTFQSNRMVLCLPFNVTVFWLFLVKLLYHQLCDERM